MSQSMKETSEQVVYGEYCMNNLTVCAIEYLTHYSRVFDERIADESSYPSIVPSVGDSPQYDKIVRRHTREDSPMRDDVSGNNHQKLENEHLQTAFAAPG